MDRRASLTVKELLLGAGSISLPSPTTWHQESPGKCVFLRSHGSGYPSRPLSFFLINWEDRRTKAS